MHTRRGLFLFAVVLAACGVPSEGGEDEVGEPVGQVGQHVQAGCRNCGINQDISNYNVQHIRLLRTAQLRDSRGLELGISLNNYWSDGVQLQGLEEIASESGKTLYWHRGTNVGGTAYPSGQIWVYDLERRPSICTSCVGSNGSFVPATATVYYKRPQKIPVAMYYRGVCVNDMFTFRPYGTPGESAGIYNYSTMTWNLTDVCGGGSNRRVLKDGERIVLTDAEVRRLTSYDVTTGQANGWVEWIYVRAFQNGVGVYGWTVRAHNYNGVTTYHVSSS